VPALCSGHKPSHRPGAHVVRRSGRGIGACAGFLVETRRPALSRERASSLIGRPSKRLLAARLVHRLAGRMALGPAIIRPLAAVARSEVGVSKGRGRDSERPDCERERHDLAHGNPHVLLVGPFSLGHGVETCFRAIGDAEAGRTLSARTRVPQTTSSEPARGCPPRACRAKDWASRPPTFRG
jgi:hypothetical protein